MARYRLILPVAGAAPGGQYDVVWPALALSPNPAMAPLDAAALSLIQRNTPAGAGNWPNAISS
jgi:hypothetical protein